MRGIVALLTPALLLCFPSGFKIEFAALVLRCCSFLIDVESRNLSKREVHVTLCDAMWFHMLRTLPGPARPPLCAEGVGVLSLRLRKLF